MTASCGTNIRNLKSRKEASDDIRRIYILPLPVNTGSCGLCFYLLHTERGQVMPLPYENAVYSPCEKYRYCLTRRWGEGKSLCFIMLNPSTATEEQNDPTVERCERRARKWEYAGIDIINLFAYRATNPKDMKACDDPVGGRWNDVHTFGSIQDSKCGYKDIICGWGTHGGHNKRDQYVYDLLRDFGLPIKALEWTKHGHPKHPLYVPYSATPIERHEQTP